MAAIQHSEAEGLTFEKMAKTIALGTEIFSAAMSLVCGPQQTIPLAGERIITLEEVSWHDTPKDCWIVVYDRVYDVTDFLDEHPGGSEILLEYAGRDGTVAFRGSGHSKQAVRALDRFLVGELPLHERIFRKPGGYRLSDIPD